MSAREASKASPRCTAAAATTTAASPIASAPTRCTAATARTSYLSRRRRDDLAQPVERRRVGGVLQPDHAVVVVVVAHGADEHVDAAGSAVRHGRQHLGHVERGLADVDESDDGRLGAHRD